MTTIWKCEDKRVLDLLSEVRKAHHPDLAEARIVVLFREPAAKRGGKTVLGTMSKASAKDKGLLADEEADYILTLSSEDWHPAPERWRRALLDHELSHCQRREKEKKVKDENAEVVDTEMVVSWGTCGHDIEEFAGVLKRHGAWHDSIREVVETLKQIELFPEHDEPTVEAIGLEGAGKSVTLTAAHRPILEEAAKKLRRQAAP